MPTPLPSTFPATARDVADGCGFCTEPVEHGEPMTTVSDFPWHADCARREASALVAA